MRSMQHLNRINAIVSRARTLNLSLRVVCLGAGVEYSTVWRWQQGRSSPVMSHFAETTATLEAHLAALEKTTHAALQQRKTGT